MVQNTIELNLIRLFIIYLTCLLTHVVCSDGLGLYNDPKYLLRYMLLNIHLLNVLFIINYDVNMLVYVANSLKPKYEYFFYGYSNTWILFHFNSLFGNYFD